MADDAESRPINRQVATLNGVAIYQSDIQLLLALITAGAVAARWAK